jgi:hypothetical protein
MDRLEFTSRSIDEIKKITNKEKIEVVICFTNINDSDTWRLKSRELVESGIEASEICINATAYDGTNYMNKIRHLVNTDCKYSCSMDDDILIPSFLWDYMIENIEVLDNDNNLFIAPLISNGIPTVDLFIEDFCTDAQKEEIKNTFLNTRIENMWGANYELLNRKRDEWNYDYYDDVRKIDHYYKGIHPVRVSIDAHTKIAQFICDNPSKLMDRNSYRLDIRKFPYFCNSFYLIRTEIWKKIIMDDSLFRDPYDEVPLNLYMQYNDLNMVFVRNGFCLHMAYNTINTPDRSYQKEIEEYYKTNLIGKI